MAKKVLGTKYVPEYAGDYFSKPWYEQDLMGYFDYLGYQDMSKEPTEYFKNEKLVNFDIMHHECRGDPLNGSYKDYQTVKFNHLSEYPTVKKKNAMSGPIRNFKQNDLLVEKGICKRSFQTATF